MEREKFGSRLGFLLLSAGCAIGIGNVWKFPYMVGSNGGGIFVLFYLFFLAIIGVPVLSMELAIGRASRKSTVRAYEVLEKPGQKWHIHGWIAMIGNYLLMMFYTVVAGWMLYYFFSFLTGKFQQLSAEQVTGYFGEMLGSWGILVGTMLLVTAAGFLVCSFGLQNGVERVTKWMMLALLVTMVFLAFYSFTMPGASNGLKFYLVPDIGKVEELGIGKIITAAMNQAFFTLSLGIGAMLIFGSYLDQGKTLLGESIQIACLDTFVALVSGMIIFPACFSFGVQPDSGPSLIFITLPHIFTSMEHGRIFGSFFFLFLFFASFSTVIAVFENILSCFRDLVPCSRKKAALLNCILVAVGSLPCALGYNLWSSFQPLGKGSSVLDLEDFLVSNLLLPIGSLIYLLFCISRRGWGFENYQAEANRGEGIRISNRIKGYLKYILPLLIVILIVQGLC
ncbi:MAG: sodium-dependent transporter [Fusicatenibacter sp.]|nr:sodium-dependent transporter [Fusicatenibacter sp.]